MSSKPQPIGPGIAYAWTPIPAQAFDFTASGQAEDEQWREDPDDHLVGQIHCAYVDSRGVFVETADERGRSHYYFGKLKS